jgi:hypothetical protein
VCKLKSLQILVVALSVAVLIGLAAVLYWVLNRPNLTLESPVGGETWQPDSTQQIRWRPRGRVQTVLIEVSTEDGAFQRIGLAPGDSGMYTWRAPATPASNVRVRISSADDAKVNAVSAPFRIGEAVGATGGPINVTSPEAGAQWPVNAQRNISWTATGVTEDLALSYTTGGDYVAIQTVPAQPGTFAWVVPNTPSNSARVRISSTISPGISATSSLFSIVGAQPSLALTSPQGGEIWPVGSTQNIRWTSTSASGNVRLSWSFDGGPSRVISDAVPISVQTYAWTLEPICQPFTENARITVESLAHPGLSATSPQPFTISTPALRADASTCLPQGRCYLTNDPAISTAGYQNGTVSAPWLLTGQEAVAGPIQEAALQEFRWALYEPLVCDRLGDGPYELIMVLCTGAQCTTNRCQFVYDAQGGVGVTCFSPEPGLPAGWGVALPFPYVLTGGLLVGALLIAAGVYLRLRARSVAGVG